MNEAQAVAHHTSGINWVDMLVIFMMIVSGLFAMTRGFVKEGFVLVSLICGTIAATKFYPVVQPWMREQIASRVTADICAWLGIFVLTLIIFIPISTTVVGRVQGQAMTAIDRSLGFVFGALRGVLISCLLFLLISQFWDKPKDTPYWIKEAKTRPILEYGAALIKELVPIRQSRDKKQAGDSTDDQNEAESEADESKAERIEKAKELLQNLSRPEPELNRNQPAYDENAREHLNELIEKKTAQ